MELKKVEYELDGVYEVVGERVLERDADGKPIRTEKVYAKVRGGDDDLLDEDYNPDDGGNSDSGDNGGGASGGDFVG